MQRSSLMRVALGGAAGATVRWALDAAAGPGSETLVWPLLVVNAVGCALLGAVIVRGNQAGRELLGIGLAGGLTSMSALALALALRLDSGDATGAGSLAALALCTGIAAFIAAEAATRRWSAVALHAPDSSDEATR